MSDRLILPIMAHEPGSLPKQPSSLPKASSSLSSSLFPPPSHSATGRSSLVEKKPPKKGVLSATESFFSRRSVFKSDPRRSLIPIFRSAPVHFCREEVRRRCLPPFSFVIFFQFPSFFRRAAHPTLNSKAFRRLTLRCLSPPENAPFLPFSPFSSFSLEAAA